MITFIIGILILVFGYIFYSRYVEKQFEPDDRKTPAYEMEDGLDYVPLSQNRNMLIHLLNIAGLGPILGAIQGIMFGPVAYIIIPLGCILMGGVHDYFSAMVSIRNNGAQVSDLVKKYLGENAFKIFIVLVSAMLLLVACVFVYTSGDIIAKGFFNQTDFSLHNPVIITIYTIIASYFILATLLPIDKIIGKFYPAFAVILLLSTLFILGGVIIKGCSVPEFNIHNINLHPKHIPIIPIFFVTVSCGLLSGFHSTQATIISRTLQKEKQGRKIFYGMMCIESLIAMIWALATNYVYIHNIGDSSLYGTANMINLMAEYYTIPILAAIITLGAVILPITSGDTALRSLRLTLADCFNIKQEKISNRLKIVIPVVIGLCAILVWAKTNPDSFGIIWRYFNFGNQLIAIPTFAFSTVFLYKHKKNYWMTLLPGLFYVFITMSFIFNAQIGFNLPLKIAEIIALVITVISCIFIFKKAKQH